MQLRECQPEPTDGPSPNFQFYKQYRKIHKTSYLLAQQIRYLNQRKDNLWAQLLLYQEQTEKEFKDRIRGEAPERKKKNRRTAQQIDRKYTCLEDRCSKNYGSEGSLIQHIKLKHPERMQELLAALEIKLKCIPKAASSKALEQQEKNKQKKASKDASL